MSFKYICIVFVILLAYFISILVAALDLTKTVVLHDHTKCQRIPLKLQTEDLAAFGNFLIGATVDGIPMFFKNLSVSKMIPGGLISINSETKEVSSIEIHNFSKEYQMNGHGINLYNNKTLYVLSHSYSKGGEIIFAFDLAEKDGKVEATYIKSIKLGNEHGIYNSIFFVNQDTFFITQFSPFQDQVDGRDMSFFTELYRTYLSGFTTSSGIKLCKVNGDSANCELKAKGYMPNGIAVLGKELFVADSINKVVDIFEIKEDYEIVKKITVLISHSVDNLHFHNNDAYIAGVGRTFDLMLFSDACKNDKPLPFVQGGVTKISKVGETWIAKEIIMQDKLSFVTGSVVIGNQLAMSSIYDKAVLLCPLD